MRRVDDIETVLEAVGEGLRALEVPFLFCGINIVDDSGGSPSVTAYSMRRQGPSERRWQTLGGGLIAQFWRGGEPVYRLDLAREDPFAESSGMPAMRAVVDVPFSHGTLAASSPEPGAFAQRDLDILCDMAAVLSDGLRRLDDEPNIRNPGPEDEGKDRFDMPYTMPPEELLAAYELIKRLDPNHPVWLNLAYGYEEDHRAYRHVADIHSDDVYPVSKYPLAHVAQFSDSVVKGAAGKLGWMYVQMAPLRGGPGDRPPTITEARCMTYMAIAHGISGITYFSFHYGDKYEGEDWTWWVDESNPGYWAQWADLTAELRTLTPYLVTPEVPEPVEVKIVEESADGTTTLIDPPPKELGYSALHVSLRKARGSYFLIAVNGRDEPLKVRFALPLSEEGFAPKAAVRFENRLVDIVEGTFDDDFAPYAVHLYEIPLNVEIDRPSVSWPRWQRRAGY